MFGSATPLDNSKEIWTYLFFASRGFCLADFIALFSSRIIVVALIMTEINNNWFLLFRAALLSSRFISMFGKMFVLCAHRIWHNVCFRVVLSDTFIVRLCVLQYFNVITADNGGYPADCCSMPQVLISARLQTSSAMSCSFSYWDTAKFVTDMNVYVDASKHWLI